MIEGTRRGDRPDPELPSSIPALLRDRARGPGSDTPAWRLLDAATEVRDSATYAELYRRSAWAARELARAGVGPGGRVVLLMDSRLEFYYALFGAMLLGALPVAVYPPLDPRQLESSVAHVRGVGEDLGAAACVTVPRLYGVARQARARGCRVVVLDPVGEADGAGLPGLESEPGDAPVLLQYTSGSLGEPRAIEVATPAIYANLLAIGDAFGMRDGDVGLSWLPLYHDMGLHSVFFGLMFRMPALLMSPLDFVRRPSSWIRALSRYGVTHSPAPNFGYAFAARRVRDADLAGVDLSRWRVAMCGAEPINPQVLERFAARFAPHGFDRGALMPAYGLAENVVGVTFAEPGAGLRVDRVDADALERKRVAEPAGDGRALDVVSVGRPLAGHRVRIAGDDAGSLPDGRVGEVQVCGPGRMRGYRDDADATRRAFDGDWLRTGDLGYARGGELYVTGRAKELIIRGGRNYYPQDLEKAATLAGVARGGVAAFGRTDPASGTEEVVVVAEVRGRAEPALAERIRVAVRESVGVSVHDVALVERGAVPKTSSGKLRRGECRARYEAGTLAPPQRPGWRLLARVGALGLLPARVQRLWTRVTR